MKQALRMVVMDSSALLSTLQNFTDPHHPTLNVLTQLITPDTAGEQLIHQVLIPDHIFYELTGILPISLTYMKEKFAAAKNDPVALQRLIEMYAQASPRGDKNDPGDTIKNHVRALLYFVAHHPEALVQTTVAAQYCKRLKADYSMLCAYSEADLTHYRPNFADAFHHLGNDFHAQNLRVHIGQLMMMGLITEREYNERMGEEESNGSRKRFLYTEEMLGCLHGKSLIKGKNGADFTKKRHILSDKSYASLLDHERQFIKEKSKAARADAHYLTVRLFEEYPLLKTHLEHLAHKAKLTKKLIRKKLDTSDEVREALGPSQLLIEHYCYGGIIPNNNPALLVVATALGIETADLDPHAANGAMRKTLHERGCFEISPTLGQLRQIQALLQEAAIDAPILDRFIQGVAHQPHVLRDKFNNACKSHENEHTLPYEKVFTHALVNGPLTWGNFLDLLVQSHSLHDSQGLLSSASGDLLVDKQSGMLYLDTQGIQGRRDKYLLGYMEAPIEQRMVDGTIRSYYRISSSELLQCTWRELTQPAKFPKRISPLFEALLAPAVKQDAAKLRQIARHSLGEDNLLQMEKDFANRYARKHLSNAPPYRNIFAALHTTSRITRKNLGEVATLEVAQSVSEQHPHAHVWVINHDSDLFPDATTGKPQLEASILRQHAGLLPTLPQLNNQSLANPHLHFVNTVQFLDSLTALLGHEPAIASQWGHYPASSDTLKKPYRVLDKARVRRDSSSWRSQIQRDIDARADAREAARAGG